MANNYHKVNRVHLIIIKTSKLSMTLLIPGLKTKKVSNKKWFNKKQIKRKWRLQATTYLVKIKMVDLETIKTIKIMMNNKMNIIMCRDSILHPISTTKLPWQRSKSSTLQIDMLIWRILMPATSSRLRLIVSWNRRSSMTKWMKQSTKPKRATVMDSLHSRFQLGSDKTC